MYAQLKCAVLMGNYITMVPVSSSCDGSSGIKNTEDSKLSRPLKTMQV